MSKQCTGPCGRTLNNNQFNSRGKGKQRARCRECLNLWQYMNPLKTGGERLIAFGSTMERSCAEALLQHGDIVTAAAAMQLDTRQLRAHLSELYRRAATRGYSPGSDVNAPTPEGYHVKGVSTYYKTNADGTTSVRGQWVKTKKDDEDKIEQLLAAMSTIADSWKGKAEPVPMPEVDNDDLLAVYPMGDPHLGMLAWPGDTGNKFDLDIAEHNLYSAVDHLVALAPRCKHALVISLGDFFHADNPNGTTTRGTRVDVDGRYPKVLATGIRLMRRCIDRALERHEIVDVICEIGNHDLQTSMMLALCLAQFYEKEPRVRVNTSAQAFHFYRFGKVLIGVHHGDRVKRENLLGVMAVDQRKAWGESEHCYWYIGHVHHETLKELPGVIVESFRTLAARDEWHHGQGYRAGRDMKLHIHHREFGKIRQHTVDVSMLNIRTD